MYRVNINYLIFNCFSLRWFILGKHSNVVFTNNTNTEQSIETNLLEENDCLTRTIITDSNLDENDQTVVIDDVANLESAVGVRQIVVPETYLDILEQFEVPNYTYININNNGTKKVLIITTYLCILASH